jgi:hypothetical protein
MNKKYTKKRNDVKEKRFATDSGAYRTTGPLWTTGFSCKTKYNNDPGPENGSGIIMPIDKSGIIYILFQLMDKKGY